MDSRMFRGAQALASRENLTLSRPLALIPELAGHFLENPQFFACQALDSMLRDLVQNHIEPFVRLPARSIVSPSNDCLSSRLCHDCIALGNDLVDSFCSFATVAISRTHSRNCAETIFGLVSSC